jgi:hypothetical protein
MYFADAKVSSDLDWLKLNFQPFVFIPGSDHAESCAIESVDRKIITKMKLRNVPELDSLEIVASEIHEIVVRRLALQYECSYSNTEVSITNRKQINDEGTVIYCSVGRATATGGKVTVSRGITDITPLRSMLELPFSIKDRWAGILHHVQAPGDPVVEFLGCYQILAAHHGDDQDKIDKFIKSNEPGVRMEVRDRFKKDRTRPTQVTETIYRRLRNELMHVLDFASPRDPREIYTEVKKYRSGLARLAKMLISQLN